MLTRCARRHDVIAVWLKTPELTLPRTMLRTVDPETKSAMMVPLVPDWDPELGHKRCLRASYRRLG